MDSPSTPLADPQFRRIWQQRVYPVFFRAGHNIPIIVRLPYRHDNKDWLRGDYERVADWNTAQKWWELPDEEDFDALLELALTRYHVLYAAWENGSDTSLDWYLSEQRFTFQWKCYTYRCGLFSRCTSGASVDLPAGAPEPASVISACIEWSCARCAIDNSFWDTVCRVCQEIRPRH